MKFIIGDVTVPNGSNLFRDGFLCFFLCICFYLQCDYAYG